MAHKNAWKIEVVPWDHSNSEHVERLLEQRMACGWREEEVPLWVESAKQGKKMFYWAVLSGTLPDRDVLMGKHIEAYPKEVHPIQDTATEIWRVQRQPPGRMFHPIGHFALELHSAEEDKELGLPSPGTVWFHHLYLSYVLQGGGLGFTIMSNAEITAIHSPMNANTMALDTLTKEMITDPSIPVPVISKEEWYSRLGYETYKKAPGYTWNKNGHVIQLEVAYMKKKLV